MTAHTFTPWTESDGQLIRSPQSEWAKPVEWNREAGTLEHIGGHNRPTVTCPTDIFAGWDGPVVDERGQIILRPYLDSENTDEYRITDCVEDWWESGEWKTPQDPQGWSPVKCADLLADVFPLIDLPKLDWQLRTAHPQNVRRIWPTVFGDAYERAIDTNENRGHPRQFRENVHLDVITSGQAEVDERIPELLKCRDLVGSVGLWWTGGGALDLTRLDNGGGETYDALRARVTTHRGHSFTASDSSPLDRVTLSASIKPDAPPLDLQDVREVRDQCIAAGVVFRIERLGAMPFYHHAEHLTCHERWHLCTKLLIDKPHDGVFADLSSPDGSDPEEWPEDLREHAT